MKYQWNSLNDRKYWCFQNQMSSKLCMNNFLFESRDWFWRWYFWNNDKYLNCLRALEWNDLTVQPFKEYHIITIFNHVIQRLTFLRETYSEVFYQEGKQRKWRLREMWSNLLGLGCLIQRVNCNQTHSRYSAQVNYLWI